MSHMTNDTSIWVALADSKRCQIINLLEEKPRTTSNLSEFFDVSRFAVMKHLNILEQANLIEVKREGRKRWNVLNDDLAHFLRTKLAGDDTDSRRLVDILGLFPGQMSVTPITSTAAHFSRIEQSILLHATPSQIFTALTDHIDAWWSQRISTSSKIYLEPIINGRFYEAFNTDGQGALYATITYVKQNEELRLSGTLELTKQIADIFVPTSFVRIILQPQENSTQLILHHHIAGNIDEATKNVCQHRWQFLLNKQLKLFIEKDIRYQPQT